MAAVNKMLGYSYGLSGQVIMGNQLGHELGFPTANIMPPANKALPPCGVYAGRVACLGGVYDAVVNLGYKPTVENQGAEKLVEAHIFDAQLKLYGERITVYFMHFLREEKCFAGLHELKEQINMDCREALGVMSGQ